MTEEPHEQLSVRPRRGSILLASENPYPSRLEPVRDKCRDIVLDDSPVVPKGSFNAGVQSPEKTNSLVQTSTDSGRVASQTSSKRRLSAINVREKTPRPPQTVILFSDTEEENELGLVPYFRHDPDNPFQHRRSSIGDTLSLAGGGARRFQELLRALPDPELPPRDVADVLTFYSEILDDINYLIEENPSDPITLRDIVFILSSTVRELNWRVNEDLLESVLGNHDCSVDDLMSSPDKLVILLTDYAQSEPDAFRQSYGFRKIDQERFQRHFNVFLKRRGEESGLLGADVFHALEAVGWQRPTEVESQREIQKWIRMTDDNQNGILEFDEFIGLVKLAENKRILINRQRIREGMGRSTAPSRRSIAALRREFWRRGYRETDELVNHLIIKSMIGNVTNSHLHAEIPPNSRLTFADVLELAIRSTGGLTTAIDQPGRPYGL
jgi:hypothetical protein